MYKKKKLKVDFIKQSQFQHKHSVNKKKDISSLIDLISIKNEKEIEKTVGYCLTIEKN